MDQLMEEELAVPPAIRANDDAMADRDAAGSVGNDLGAARGFRQFLAIGKRDSVHDEDPDAGDVLHAGPSGVGHLVCGERDAVLKNVFFLAFRPLRGERGEAVEFFLVNHNWGEVVRFIRSMPCAKTSLGPHFSPLFRERICVVCQGPPF